MKKSESFIDELALKTKSTEMLKEMVNRMIEGILAIGHDGTILFANPAASEMLGISRSRLIGKKVGALFLDNPINEDFVQCILDAVEIKNQPVRTVVPFKSKRGKKRHLQVATSYLENSELGVAVSMVLEDVSEIFALRDSVKAMKQINELNRQLKKRNDLLSRTFGMFLSDEIVSTLIDTPDGLTPGGKKKSVAMMMSDLRGFTAMSEQMDAEDLILMLNHYLGAMTVIIQKHRGTIIEFIGDGIQAVFGAPIDSETYADDAVATALEMQSAMKRINRWNAERGFPHLKMGIGLDAGEVIVGNIGSMKRMKYGVVGNHVNLCGRIESYTVGGQTLISPDVRQLVKAKLEIAGEMTVFPKGAEGEIVLSHVIGIGKPYDIHVSTARDATKKLEKPVPVSFRVVDGKHTQNKQYFGGITAIGRNSAIMETQAALKEFANIQVEAGGDLFCKVTERSGDACTLDFTAIPSSFDKWMRSLV